MTSTNRAFIDAYRSRRPARPAIHPTAQAPEWIGTAELLSATASRLPAVRWTSTESPVLVVEEPAETSEAVAHRDVRVEAASGQTGRRPLSTFRAEAAHLVTKQDQSTPIDSLRQAGLTFPPTCRLLLSTAADQYDTLLGRFPSGSFSNGSFANGGGALIGVIGAGEQAGCSTTAICLALRSAALGCPTMLVDADLSHPELATMLGTTAARPWNALLKSSEPVATALVRAKEGQIDLLLAGPDTLTQLNPTARFRASLAAGWLRRQYGRVIIDLGHVADATGDRLSCDLAAAMRIDHLIAVTAPHTTSDQLAAMTDRLRAHQLEVAGIVAAA